MGITTNETSRRFSSNADSAVYTFDRAALYNNISRLGKAFTSLYTNFQIAYSFKTNYLQQICEDVGMNCMAEVVSPYEYSYAQALGYLPECIVYNGVIPDPEEKFELARAGGYVNVDNIEEYQALSRLAGELHKPICLGVRVNFDVGNGLCSRFGVDINGEEFKTLMEEIRQDEFVKLRGFHCHIGTSRQAIYWKRKVDTMIWLAKEYGAAYLDLGGGMFGKMPAALAGQFSDYVGEFDEYAEVVARTMKDAFPDERVKLILEPGTALVGNTFELEAHVVNIKNVRGKTYVTLDCTSNHIGMLCECREITYRVVPTGDGDVVHVEDATLAGSTCLEYDYIRQHFTDDIRVGDTIIFENVGAYSISASRQFIVPRLAVLDKHTREVLRYPEKEEDMFLPSGGRYVISDRGVSIYGRTAPDHGEINAANLSGHIM